MLVLCYFKCKINKILFDFSSTVINSDAPDTIRLSLEHFVAAVVVSVNAIVLAGFRPPPL